MRAGKTERQYRKAVVYESQRHLGAVRAKFLKQYQGEQPKSTQQAVLAQDDGFTARDYR